jgi:hypothetical protein
LDEKIEKTGKNHKFFVNKGFPSFQENESASRPIYIFLELRVMRFSPICQDRK